MSPDVDCPARSTIKLNPTQVAVLEWIQSGCPDGVYPNDSYTHRITARALASRGLVRISGHGASWRAEPTERGRDRKSTRLNSSHVSISYAVFCLQKKK